MSQRVSKYAVLLGTCALALFAAACSQAEQDTMPQAGQTVEVPDLSGSWSHIPMASFQPPPEGPGPVANLMEGQGRGIWHGDHEAPILRPWAAEIVRRQALAERAENSPLTSQQTCSPSGVPNIMQLPDVVQFLQTPDHVAIVYARDHQVRIVHLNQDHPDDLKHTWYGHSVGHYEGDTLVVDTIAMHDKTWTDRVGTPHTDQIHVVERYRVLEDGTLENHFTVDDPGAFTMVWSAIMIYTPARGSFTEQICAENPRDGLTGGFYPIPMAW